MVVVYMATARLASYISTGQSDINGSLQFFHVQFVHFVVSVHVTGFCENLAQRWWNY